MSSSRRRWVTVVLVAGVLGCEGQPFVTAPGGSAQGSFRFDYSGALSGTFSVTGSPQVGDGEDAVPVSHAAAYEDVEAGYTYVYGIRITGQSTADLAVIRLKTAETGQYDANLLEGETGFVVGFDLDLNDEDFGQNARIFGSTEGQINVTQASAGRLGGSFQATVLDEVSGVQLQVTNGSFSTPLLSSETPPGSIDLPISGVISADANGSLAIDRRETNGLEAGAAGREALIRSFLAPLRSRP